MTTPATGQVFFPHLVGISDNSVRGRGTDQKGWRSRFAVEMSMAAVRRTVPASRSRRGVEEMPDVQRSTP